MLGTVARVSHQMGRNFMINSIRNGSTGGIPGQNLPFQIHNRTRLTVVFFFYSLTGFVAPFLICDWQIRKNVTKAE